MTLDTNTDLLDDHLDAVAERLDEAYEKARADSVRTGTDGTTLHAVPAESRHGADLHKHLVGRVGLEPTTDGL
jgi:hypothetical protein